MADCFKCGRFLGEEDEWKKLDTEKGPICFVCYNEVSAQEKMDTEAEKAGKAERERRNYWADEEADRILKAKKAYRLSTGISPSGEIHIGNLREVTTADAIYRVLKERGENAEFHYIADDFDPLRRVYPFLDQSMYEPLVGKPLSEIPCPCGNHQNYAEHFLLPFVQSLGQLKIELTVYRASEVYKSGRMNPLIIEALRGREKLMMILSEMTGKQFEDDWSPFNPLCNVCGKMTNTSVTGFSEKDETVSYKCACGNEATIPIAGGGKLTWRIDWPARWKLFRVTIEPFGKDHATRGGSYDTGKRIVKEVFHYEPPYPIPYEWISLKGMGDMSSSKGNVLSIERVLTIVPPEILRYMILKAKPLRSIQFDPALPLLSLIDEYDDKEAKGRDKRAVQLSQAAGFTSVDIPYRHIVVVSQIARFDVGRTIQILARSGYTFVNRTELEKRMLYARRWLDEFAPEDIKFEVKKELPQEAKDLSPQQKQFLKKLSETLKEGMSGDEIHQMVYSIAQTISDVKPPHLFEALYIALLGKKKGPRAGWFLAFLDHQFVISRFADASA